MTKLTSFCIFVPIKTLVICVCSGLIEFEILRFLEGKIIGYIPEVDGILKIALLIPNVLLPILLYTIFFNKIENIRYSLFLSSVSFYIGFFALTVLWLLWSRETLDIKELVIYLYSCLPFLAVTTFYFFRFRRKFARESRNSI